MPNIRTDSRESSPSRDKENSDAYRLRRRHFLCPVLLHGLLAGVIVAARLLQNGSSPPAFSAADNPAAFAASSDCASHLHRVLTHLYLACFHVEQLLWPAVLSYDWQMGAVPLVSGLADRRNLETAALFLLLGRLGLQAAKDRWPPGLTFGLLFLVLPFVPASNLFFRVGFVAAERDDCGHCAYVIILSFFFPE